ncbi:MAG: type IV secretion system DNA-binding domain-containing protein [Bacteriovoracaceae bacterium]|jgi:DNA helicase HerA-like ATPase|nr:type IV secretion system DNA-binding domain-containing protein [Bacteriovoracaceae bacterium]
MNNKKQPPQLDIFSPIYEIFHELCLLLAELGKEFIKWVFKKTFSKNLVLVKIDRKALNVKKTTDLEDSLGIDTKNRKDFLLDEIDFRRHSFIVGASGFGKTNLMSILQEHTLRKNKPIIFFDPKGDMEALNTFKEICERYKKPCYIFSEHYHDSISLNPVLEGTVNQVTDRIMRAFEWSEPYYRDASRRSLTKSLKILEASDQAFTLQAIFEELEKMESKENIGLIAKIEAILESDFGKILNSDNEGLTLSKVREERACLYIGLSTQGYGETAMAVGKLFLGELLYNSYKTLSDDKDPKTGLKNPISVYFDEFGSLVTPEFIELQNKCRGAGIELTLAVQTASDIDRVNSDLTKQIIENSGNLFVLKQRMADSAKFFAESIGTVISKKQTFRIENGEQMESGSEREVHELIVHSDIIKNLNIGQCVLLRQGPTRLNLLNIRNRSMDDLKKLNKLMSKNKV